MLKSLLPLLLLPALAGCPPEQCYPPRYSGQILNDYARQTAPLGLLARVPMRLAVAQVDQPAPPEELLKALREPVRMRECCDTVLFAVWPMPCELNYGSDADGWYPGDGSRHSHNLDRTLQAAADLGADGLLLVGVDCGAGSVTMATAVLIDLPSRKVVLHWAHCLDPNTNPRHSAEDLGREFVSRMQHDANYSPRPDWRPSPDEHRWPLPADMPDGRPYRTRD
jgi:hypothetical protein